MRLLRWAADKPTSNDEGARLVALSGMEALDESKPTMLQLEDQGIQPSPALVAIAHCEDQFWSPVGNSRHSHAALLG